MLIIPSLRAFTQHPES